MEHGILVDSGDSGFSGFSGFKRVQRVRGDRSLSPPYPYPLNPLTR